MSLKVPSEKHPPLPSACRLGGRVWGQTGSIWKLFVGVRSGSPVELMFHSDLSGSFHTFWSSSSESCSSVTTWQHIQKIKDRKKKKKNWDQTAILEGFITLKVLFIQVELLCVPQAPLCVHRAGQILLWCEVVRCLVRLSSAVLLAPSSPPSAAWRKLL